MEPRFLQFNFQNFVTINLMVLLMALLVMFGAKMLQARKTPAQG